MNTLNPEVIQDPEDKVKLLDVIKVCADSMTRMAGEKDLIKEATKKISKELGIPKPIISKLIKVYFNQNFDAEVAVHEEFEALYQTVVK
ncbi:hypothetical protein M0R04_04210 [Candidatus Dojkabacteria bacterium]|jgi:hypothetical protein|nr:hypothetical protein [Candidatus Dojkabacteria bacterium]